MQLEEKFGKFLNRLSDLVDIGINVVVTAHSKLNKFEQPDEMGAYDRYELKLGNKTTAKTASLLKEWADMVLFCNYKTYSIATDDKGKKFKGQGGKRVMHTTHHPAWDAKNRVGLPEEIDMDYANIAHIFEAQPVVQDTAHSQKADEEKQEALADNFMDIPEGAPEQMEFDASPSTKPEPVKQEEKPPQTEQKPLAPNSVFRVSERIPKALRDLMEDKLVSEEEVRKVVSQKGYYPEATPIANYDPNFISGVLVGAWTQVYGMIEKLRETSVRCHRHTL